jgi:hypothetical protein
MSADIPGSELIQIVRPIPMEIAARTRNMIFDAVE